MRKAIALVAGLAVLAFVNFGIYQREQLLTDGKVVLLRLSPVDPRSLMQGDYMRLNFEAADQAFPFERRRERADGHIIVAVDPQGVGHFRRFADGGPLAADEMALRYRIRGGQPSFATNAFFFEEGQARAYEAAQYGEFRVSADGDMILTGLRDDGFNALGSDADPNVELASTPIGSIKQGDRFTFHVRYRMIPPGSGLLVSIDRISEDRRLREKGGAVTMMPVDIEGSGSTELAFEGTAISAPADAPYSHPVPAGEYRLRARVKDNRRSPWSMLAEDQGRVLAETTSAPFRIE